MPKLAFIAVESRYFDEEKRFAKTGFVILLFQIIVFVHTLFSINSK